MAAYFALRIEAGKLNYNTVVAKWVDYAADIQAILAADGYIINSDGTVSKS